MLMSGMCGRMGVDMQLSVLCILSYVQVWMVFFFFSSRRRHTRFDCDWSSDVCSSDLALSLDQQGVVHADRSDLDEYRRRFAVRGKARTLAEALQDADVFVGLSVGGIVKIGRASCRERV